MYISDTAGCLRFMTITYHGQYEVGTWMFVGNDPCAGFLASERPRPGQPGTSASGFEWCDGRWASFVRA